MFFCSSEIAAVGCDCLACIAGGAGGVTVNAGAKARVGGVHLAETGEDGIGAGVVVGADVVL